MTSRRTLLRGIFALTLAMAVASVDMLPRLGRRAATEPSTRIDCDYPDSWKICNPAAASVSSIYCNASGYHRTDDYADACESVVHVRDFRCGPMLGGGSYNAWVWRKSWGPNNRSRRARPDEVPLARPTSPGENGSSSTNERARDV